ncbi:MAG: hypothetical protein IK002_02460 [Treponema sp.]|uniref:hypothetical protein n=1 Tax=Treponema sp. TaxID=166 RepID=UPI00298E114A|nr:hypothetical protein [Treponema sp.]MBR5932827.1 hypothetical protein [Treponema sp.]
MKKFLLALTVIMTFVSCSNSIEVKNEHGWWTDYDECLKSAKANNKRIMMVVSSDEIDKMGLVLKQDLFHTEEFISKYGDKYEFCEIDVSPSLFINAFPESNIPKDIRDDKKKSKEFLKERRSGKGAAKKILDKRMKIVAVYDIQHRPMMLVMTKEGYPVFDVPYFQSAEMEMFGEMMAYYDPLILGYEKFVEDVNNAEGLDRVIAIDALYNNTNNAYRYSLTPLLKEVPKLDQANETKLVGKYLLAIATSDTIDATIARKPQKTISIYEKVAKNKFLTKQEQQTAYFAELYLIGKNTPTEKEIKQMTALLDKIIAIDSESAIGKQAASKLEQLKEFVQRKEEYEKKIKEESEGADN